MWDSVPMVTVCLLPSLPPSAPQSSDLGVRLARVLDQYQQYQDEAGSLDSWLTTQEQNQAAVGLRGEQTDARTLQHALHALQVSRRAALPSTGSHGLIVM